APAHVLQGDERREPEIVGVLPGAGHEARLVREAPKFQEAPPDRRGLRDEVWVENLRNPRLPQRRPRDIPPPFPDRESGYENGDLPTRDCGAGPPHRGFAVGAAAG